MATVNAVTFPFARLTILAVSLLTVWSILRRRYRLFGQIFCRSDRFTESFIIAVLYLVPTSLLYGSLVSIVSIVSSGLRAMLFPAFTLYQGAPWVRFLFVGNLFWLLVSLCLVWFIMHQFQTRGDRATWHFTLLEIGLFYVVATAALAEIFGLGQNLLVDTLPPWLSSGLPSYLGTIWIDLLAGNAFFVVILVCIVWMVHRSWSKE